MPSCAASGHSQQFCNLSLTIHDDNLVQAMQTAVQGVQTISWNNRTQALLCGMFCSMCLGTKLLGQISGPHIRCSSLIEAANQLSNTRTLHA